MQSLHCSQSWKKIFDGDVEEAISLYLHNDISDSISNINLEGRERPENSTNQALIRRIDFLDNKGGVYLIVRYIDDTPVGLVQSPILGDFEKTVSRRHYLYLIQIFLQTGDIFQYCII